MGLAVNPPRTMTSRVVTSHQGHASVGRCKSLRTRYTRKMWAKGQQQQPILAHGCQDSANLNLVPRKYKLEIAAKRSVLRNSRNDRRNIFTWRYSIKYRMCNGWFLAEWVGRWQWHGCGMGPEILCSFGANGLVIAFVAMDGT